MQSYLTEEFWEGYEPVLEELGLLLGELRGYERQAPEHGLLERHIQGRGTEVQRRLLQCCLNRLSGAQEQQPQVMGADGRPRRYARLRARTLMSLFGEVCVQRFGYADHHTDSVFPLDEQLNLPPQLYSQGVQERVGEAVAQNAYEPSVKELGAYTGAQIAKRQAEEVAQRLAVDCETFYQQRLQEALPAAAVAVPQRLSPELASSSDLPPPPTAPSSAEAASPPPPSSSSSSPPPLLILSLDSKGIVMRKEDLREATRKRAAAEPHKLCGRLSPGEKKNRKRMATVASVYEIAPQVRTAAQILDPEERAARPPPPKPVNKRVWASVEHSMEEVLDEVFAEAKRRDPQRQMQWVALLDGQEGQLSELYAAITRHGAHVTVLQDFIHISEYVWSAARCLFEEGDRQAEEWVREHLRLILEDKVSEAAAGMRRSATRRTLSQKKRAPLDKSAEHLLKNRERLGYAQALRDGLPIATGVIEGACRHLVKRRMECSGARWSLQGAEAVLRLRAVRMSGDWEAYLSFHNRAERERNYPAPPAELRAAA